MQRGSRTDLGGELYREEFGTGTIGGYGSSQQFVIRSDRYDLRHVVIFRWPVQYEQRGLEDFVRLYEAIFYRGKLARNWAYRSEHFDLESGVLRRCHMCTIPLPLTDRDSTACLVVLTSCTCVGELCVWNGFSLM